MFLEDRDKDLEMQEMIRREEEVYDNKEQWYRELQKEERWERIKGQGIIDDMES